MKVSILIFTLVIGIGTAFSQTPTWLWARGGGGPQIDATRSIATDIEGNSYVTGYFSETATFGYTSLTAEGDPYDIFVLKLDPSGNWLWAVRAGGTNYDLGKSVAADGSGNCYVAGNFLDTAYFGSHSLTYSGVNDDVFVAKLDSQGNWLWAIRPGGNGGDISCGIVADAAGNSYTTGEFWGNTVFGPSTLPGHGYNGDIFVAKADPDGNWLWAAQAGGTNYDRGNAIALDPSGNTYVTGYFQGTATFGSSSLTTSGSGMDIFVAKLDPSGNWLWARRAGSSQDTEQGNGICVDASGNCCVTGIFYGTATFGSTSLSSSGLEDSFIARLDTEGNWLWVKKAGGSGIDSGLGIATDSGGYIHTTGYHEGTATYGPFTLLNYGWSTAKLDSDGNWLWAINCPLGGSVGIAADPAGNSYLAGDFGSYITLGDIVVTGNSVNDVFVAKLSSGVSGDDEIAAGLTGVSQLSEVWPNPVRRGETLNLRANIAERETGVLGIYNLRGQCVASYILVAGSRQLSLNTGDLASGVYLCQLRTQSTSTHKKIVLLQ